MSRHLFKMLVGLLGMGIIGLICLFVVNLYENQTTPPDATPATNSTMAGTSLNVSSTIIPHTPKGRSADVQNTAQ